MAYPATPLPVEVALSIAGTWVDATTNGNGVLHRDPISIAAGRADWAGQVDPARASFTLRDADGRWSPDNQAGAYWGSLRRNIPCRIGVGLGATYLACTGATAATPVSTPNVAALSFSTAHDVRIEVQLDADPVDILSGGTQIRLASKANAGLVDGWALGLTYFNGRHSLIWAWADSGGVGHTADSSTGGGYLPYFVAYQRIALRATFDPTTGTTTFYYSTSLAGSWTQIGSPVVTGATSLKTNTDAVTLGGDATDPQGYGGLPGRVHAFELRNGIGGSVVANPDFTTQTVGASSFTDASGKVWTVGAAGRLTNMRWRFHGELAALPVRWDISGVDLTAPMEATGVFRRLRQGARPTDSPMRRGVLRTAPVQYWPMEETSNNLTTFGAAVGAASMQAVSGAASMRAAAVATFASSKPLPEIQQATLQASVDSYTSNSVWKLVWLMSIPSDATGTDNHFLHIQTSDLTWHVRWRATNGGDLAVLAYRAGTLVYDSGWISFLASGQPMLMQLLAAPNGANIDVSLYGTQPGGVAGGFSTASAVAGTPGVVQLLRFNQDANMGATGFGHVALYNHLGVLSELEKPLAGHNGETAARRVQRLCTEEGMASRIKGDPDDSEPMGVQRTGTLMALLQECADTDGGALYEARDSLGVSYRTRASMQAQTALALNYGAGNLAGTLDIDRDEQGFANDITVTTTSGTTGRAELDDGSVLSVSEPPVGAGRYSTSFDANCLDSRCNDLAGWRLRLSAVNEPAVGRMALETNLPTLVASSTLTESALTMAIGDLVSVSALPSAVLGSTVVRQIVQGTRESITMFGHRIELNTTPASPWDVLTYDGASTRYDTAGSTLASAATAGSTSLSVATSAGPLWTTSGADLPFDIDVDGVRVTVTAISGAASPQTFTVTATSRALAAGAIVRLADPTFYEL